MHRSAPPRKAVYASSCRNPSTSASNRTTFTVRKESYGVGVEKTWPLHSPIVEKVEVVRRGKVRRAKLNYLKGLTGKKAKVKELVTR